MNGRPYFGAVRGDWQRFTSIRMPCPGCAHSGRQKSHDLCRQKSYENGLLVECWRRVDGRLADEWYDLGNKGGQGCRRFFLPNGSRQFPAACTPLLSARHAEAGDTHHQCGLPTAITMQWCASLHDYAKRLHQTHRACVEEFYKVRSIPFDQELYGVGPSRREARELASRWLPEYIRKKQLPGFAGLLGVASSVQGSGAFFPAAKFGEAWEWVLGPNGERCSWSRRFLRPEREGTGYPKAKSPTNARHCLHHSPDWRVFVQESGALLLTEGVRKANETQRRTGIGCLGLPSVAISHQPRAELEAALHEVRPRFLLLAPDFADLADGDPHHDATRMQVLRWESLVDVVGGIDGYVQALAWDPKLGKGIDDVLAGLRWRADEGKA